MRKRGRRIRVEAFSLIPFPQHKSCVLPLCVNGIQPISRHRKHKQPLQSVNLSPSVEACSVCVRFLHPKAPLEGDGWEMTQTSPFRQDVAKLTSLSLKSLVSRTEKEQASVDPSWVCRSSPSQRCFALLHPSIPMDLPSLTIMPHPLASPLLFLFSSFSFQLSFGTVLNVLAGNWMSL